MKTLSPPTPDDIEMRVCRPWEEVYVQSSHSVQFVGGDYKLLVL